MLRRALSAEDFALLRLRHAAQYRTADAQRTFFRVILGDTETPLGVFKYATTGYNFAFAFSAWHTIVVNTEDDGLVFREVKQPALA